MRARALPVAALLLATACSGGGTSASTAPTAGATVSPAAAPSPSAAAAAPDSITIAGFHYSPEPLTVAPGATITVTNDDGDSHTVSSDIAGQFESNDVARQPVTFLAPKTPGTYHFHCAYHGSMHGTLVVR